MTPYWSVVSRKRHTTFWFCGQDREKCVMPPSWACTRETRDREIDGFLFILTPSAFISCLRRLFHYASIGNIPQTRSYNDNRQLMWYKHDHTVGNVKLGTVSVGGQVGKGLMRRLNVFSVPHWQRSEYSLRLGLFAVTRRKQSSSM